MTKTVKLFSLLLMFVFSTVFAESDLDKYRLYVTDVDPEYQCFALSNNMIFCVARNNLETDTFPEVGVEIVLAPWIRHPDARYFVHEGDFMARFFGIPQNHPTKICMIPESREFCLSYVSTESVCIEPDGWFFSGVYIDVIELSDGSKWIAESTDPFEFKKGDHIIVTKIGDNQWGFIDVDQNVSRKTANEEIYVHYLGVAVKPYIQGENSAK